MAVDGHGYGWVMVLETWKVFTPYSASTKVAIIVFEGKIQMDSSHFIREYRSARTCPNIEKLYKV